MVMITFVESDGEEKTIDAIIGQTLMEVATKNGVDGIIGECGGNCSCGTCCVFPSADCQSALGEISEIEQDMLEFRGDTQPGARLACRITVSEALDGLRLRLPDSQI